MVNTEIVNQIRKKNLIPIIILIGLVFLRFPLIILSAFKVISIPNVLEVCVNYTYLLTACLIIYEKDRLRDFNIGLSSVTIFIIIPILKPILYFALKPTLYFTLKPYVENSPSSWFQIVVAVILLITLIYTHPPIYKEKIKDILKWLFIFIILGLLYAAITGVVNKSFTSRTTTGTTFLIFIFLFISQLSMAALSEEPLFRGFIWGYLRKRNWKEHWILLFQAFLFSLGHIYYLPNLPVAFVVTFVGGLVLGLVVLKSKNISTSIIVHGLVNTMGQLNM